MSLFREYVHIVNFHYGGISGSICSVVGASLSVLAPVFALLSSFVDASAAIFSSSGFWEWSCHSSSLLCSSS